MGCMSSKSVSNTSIVPDHRSLPPASNPSIKRSVTHHNIGSSPSNPASPLSGHTRRITVSKLDRSLFDEPEVQALLEILPSNQALPTSSDDTLHDKSITVAGVALEQTSQSSDVQYTNLAQQLYHREVLHRQTGVELPNRRWRQQSY